MKIGFVCTNYNNSACTRAAVASLRANAGWDEMRVAVVDNSSGQDDVDHLKVLVTEFPSVDLLLSPTNVGYFAGLNIGIGHLRSNFPDIDVIVVGNNDLTFPENFLDSILRYREVFEKWAVVAPDLVTPVGVHQNPHVYHPLSRIRRLVWDVYFLSYQTAVLVRHAARITRRFTARKENLPSSELYKVPGPIEQGYGACYLLGPAFFRHFARLPSVTFMMQEEFFLYEQLKTIGQLTYYDPRFVVYHQGHAAMDRIPSRLHWKISADAHRVYKHYVSMSRADQLKFIEQVGP